MNPRVLVTYASKHGATADIANKIHEILKQAGLSADILPMDEVTNPSPYQAIVLGSAVYIGQWRRAAIRFLKAHEQALTEKQVWMFSSGPTGHGDPEKLLNGQKLPEGLQPIVARIQPRDIEVFGGVLDEDKMHFWEKWIIKNVKAPVGDFRDWAVIEAWAQGIAEDLMVAEPA
ncbi:MAG: flavodoxin domain-containing protein [Saprospirales bacterium]|nr:flavodoxin domain-containing protein [Saprospirales bacterium]MBK8490895.1 flavodoxin domain-containing protein [Saprospirales bacterium]